MNKLALSLPTFENIWDPVSSKFPSPAGAKFGLVLGEALNVLFYVGGILVFGWLIWGVFAYILARGEKEDLAKARARIVWALVGFGFLVISFAVSQYAKTIFDVNTQFRDFGKVTPITRPCSLDQEKNLNCTSQNKFCIVEDKNPKCTP